MTRGRQRTLLRRAARWGLPGALLLLPLAAGGPGAREPVAERIAVEMVILGVGDGTRTLASRRMVLDVGMSGRVAMRVGRRDGGRPVVSLCRLDLDTAMTEDGRVDLALAAEVRQGEGEGRQAWRRGGRVSLFPGTSAVVEIAPAEEPGERLVVSMTVSPAEGEAITLTPPRVDLEIAIWAVQAEEVVLLQRPRLRTLAGRPAEFAFDYPVPAAKGEGFEHVGCQLTVTPGYPQGGLLPVEIALSGGFPGADGPVLSGRETSAMLAAGQSWTTEIQPQGGAGPFLRVAVTAVWAPAGFDGPGEGPL